MSHNSSTRRTFRDSTQFKRGTDAFYRDILNLKIARNVLLPIANETLSNFHWYFRPRIRRLVYRLIKNRISLYSSTNCFAHSKEYSYLFLSKSMSNRSKAICPLFRGIQWKGMKQENWKSKSLFCARKSLYILLHFSMY